MQEIKEMHPVNKNQRVVVGDTSGQSEITFWREDVATVATLQVGDVMAISNVTTNYWNIKQGMYIFTSA